MYIARHFAIPDSDSKEVSDTELIPGTNREAQLYIGVWFLQLQLLKKIEFIIVPVANPDGYHVGYIMIDMYCLLHECNLTYQTLKGICLD